MTMLQILAAEMAGLERIVFHTGDSLGVAAIDEVKKLFEDDLIHGSPIATRELIQRIEARGLQWGVGDST